MRHVLNRLAEGRGLLALLGTTLLLGACSDDTSTPSEVTAGGASGASVGGAAGSTGGTSSGGKAGAGGAAGVSGGQGGAMGGQGGAGGAGAAGSAGEAAGGASGQSGGGQGGASSGAAGESGAGGTSGAAGNAAGESGAAGSPVAGAAGEAGAGAGGAAGDGGTAGQPAALWPSARSVVTTQNHTCAILEGGKVRCWGDNRGPLLGYGTGATLRSPAQLGPVEVGGKAVQVTTRGDHACALLDTGAVRCWGHAFRGQLGYGNKNDIGDDEPASAAGDVPVGGKVTQVSGGEEHTCALLDSGNIRCWGSGYLGYKDFSAIGDDEPASAAGDVPVGGKVTQVSAGLDHTCVLLDSGNIRCWGYNLHGQLGYGDTQNRSASEAGDVPIGGKVVQISTGYNFTCALLDTGNVRCWGQNNYAQLGQYDNGTTMGDNEPASAAGDVPIGGKVVQISNGHDHVCALLDTGNVRCWGAGYAGALGHGNKQNVGWGTTPAMVGDVPVGGKVVQISAGYLHTCALLDTGSVRCWGDGSAEGQLGHGVLDKIGDDEPASASAYVPIEGKVVSITAGRAQTCALLEGGDVVCWGGAQAYVLPYSPKHVGDDESASAPGDLPLGGYAVSLAGGSDRTCALLDNGAVRCWGMGLGPAGYLGPLGYEDPVALGDNEPAAAAGDVPVGGKVVQLVAAGGHTCALLEAGSVRCWGRNVSGQLGHGNKNQVSTPTSAGDVPVGGKVIALSAGGAGTCAVLETGRARCWGNGTDFVLGTSGTASIGDDEPASAGLEVAISGTIEQVARGARHACALLDSGNVRCWGNGAAGQLGYGSAATRLASDVGDVPVGGKVTQITAGFWHTCALLDTGNVRCWGQNTESQLGYGNKANIGDNEPAAAAGDVPVGGKVVQIVAGDFQTCALLDTGALRCWGDGSLGVLGYGTTSTIGDDETPASVGDVPVGGKVMLPPAP